MLIKLSKLQELIQSCGGKDELILTVDSVIEQFNRIIGYNLEEQSYAGQIVATDGGRYLYFPHRPVTVITKVETFSESLGEWTELTEGGVNGYVVIDTSRIFYQYHFTDIVKISYTAGYTSDTLPADIETALHTQIRYLVKRLSEANLTAKSIASGGSTASLLDADYHPLFLSCASKHKVMHFG